MLRTELSKFIFVLKMIRAPGESVEAWKKRNEEWKKKQQKNRPVPLGGYGFRKRQLEAWKNSKWGQAKLKHQKELREFQEKYKREKIAKNKAKK